MTLRVSPAQHHLLSAWAQELHLRIGKAALLGRVPWEPAEVVRDPRGVGAGGEVRCEVELCPRGEGRMPEATSLRLVLFWRLRLLGLQLP